MGKRSKDDGLVEMIVLVSKPVRAELEQIKALEGVSISQQVRCSLNLWITAVHRNPHGAQGLLGNQIAKGHKLGGWGPGAKGTGTPEPDVPQADPFASLGPEPNQATHPAAWAKWSAKQGNLMVQKLAKGEWPD